MTYNQSVYHDTISSINYERKAISKAINALVHLHIVYDETKADYTNVILPNAEHVQRLRERDAELLSRLANLKPESP
jgi:hypothetical protein